MCNLEMPYARFQTLLIVCGLMLLWQTSAAAQAAMAEGNAQRSRVLPTQSVDTAPQRSLWTTAKLFQIRDSEFFTSQNGPFTLRADIPTGHYFTTPIFSEGTLFLSAYVQTAYFYAIDAASGKQLVLLQFQDNEISSPAALGKLVFFGTQRGRVYAYDLSKRTPVWFYEQKGSSFAYTEPAVADGVVYFCGSESGLFALSAATGALLWTYKSDKPLYRPAVAGDTVVVLNQTGPMIAIDKKTGTQKWETKVGREFIGPSILGDLIFVAHVDGEVRAYALQDGALKWKSRKDGGARTPLAVFEGLVIYGEQYGNIVALDAATGVEKWRFKTKKPCGDPVVAGATLYATCKDRRLYALNAQTGESKWEFEMKKGYPTPTIANGIVYFLGSDGLLQAMQ
jgi:outer membrane protein assembly factor BamB